MRMVHTWPLVDEKVLLLKPRYYLSTHCLSRHLLTSTDRGRPALLDAIPSKDGRQPLSSLEPCGYQIGGKTLEDLLEIGQNLMNPNHVAVYDMVTYPRARLVEPPELLRDCLGRPSSSPLPFSSSCGVLPCSFGRFILKLPGQLCID